tara:strand:+ start:436 stop:561 length:126 start_codon:yes stop_codon:yes gene_type:complete
MNNGTWRQRMMDKVLRRKDEYLDGFAEIDEQINLKGKGEEE